MSHKGKGKKTRKEAATPLLMKKIQQFFWLYKCHLHFELLNYNEVGFQYTLLQYDYQIAKFHVFRPVAVPKEFTKSMPPGELTVIGQCSDDYL